MGTSSSSLFNNTENSVIDDSQKNVNNSKDQINIEMTNIDDVNNIISTTSSVPPNDLIVADHSNDNFKNQNNIVDKNNIILSDFIDTTSSVPPNDLIVVNYPNTLNNISDNIEMLDVYDMYEELIKKYFFDDNKNSEKHNDYYLKELRKIKELDKIINKTYEVDQSLDETTKKCHEKLKKVKLYKITNSNESHNAYFYKTGLNEILGKFDDQPTCRYGGLYFAQEGYILKWLDYGVYYREVYLLPDSKIVDMTDKFKTNKFILGKRKLIDLNFLNHNIKICKNYNVKNYYAEEIMRNLNLLEKIKKYNSYLMISDYDLMIILGNCTLMLKYIDNTFETRNQIYMYILRNVRKKSICSVFKLMVEPSYDVQLFAVSNNPYCITHIKNPDLKLIKAAINQTSVFLKEISIDSFDDTLLSYIDKENRSYDIQYIRNLNDTYQKIFYEKSKYNVLLMTNPSDNILNMCRSDDELKYYYNMHVENKTKYLIADNESNIKTKTCEILKKIYADKYEIFLTKLKEFDGYVSGSFVCNILYNAHHTYSDIDIYFNNYKNAIKFGEALKELEYLRMSICKYNSYSILGTHVDNIITHKVLNPYLSLYPKIQLIVINQNLNTVNYIMTYFDINYCKVAIDGDCNGYMFEKYENKTFISENIMNVMKLYSSNLELCNKSRTPDTIIYYNNLVRSMKFYIIKVTTRINKYIKRGIIFDDDNHKTFKSLMDKVNLIM